MMKKIMQRMFLSCLKATELIEKKLYFKLSIQDNLQLKLHKSLCNACQQYEKQSIFLENYIPNTTPINLTPTTDLDKLKSTIKAKIGTDK